MLIALSIVSTTKGQYFYLNSTTDASFGIRPILHNNEIKIGNTNLAADRAKNLLRFGDGINIQIGEWENDNWLSFKAKRFSFVPIDGGLNVLNSCAGSIISLTDGTGNQSGKPRLVLHQRSDIPHAYIYFNQNLYFVSDGSSGYTPLVLQYDGSVGIGFPQGFTSGVNHTKNYKLAVNGSIHTKSIDVDILNWSDFVFNKDYQLKSLNEIEHFIHENGHLPGIPDSEEVKMNGLNLGEFQSKLLQKIEELTLYLIELEKENNLLQDKISSLEKQLNN